jgi:hypothetical protein
MRTLGHSPAGSATCITCMYACLSGAHPGLQVRRTALVRVCLSFGAVPSWCALVCNRMINHV